MCYLLCSIGNLTVEARSAVSAMDGVLDGLARQLVRGAVPGDDGVSIAAKNVALVVSRDATAASANDTSAVKHSTQSGASIAFDTHAVASVSNAGYVDVQGISWASNPVSWRRAAQRACDVRGGS